MITMRSLFSLLVASQLLIANGGCAPVEGDELEESIDDDDAPSVASDAITALPVEPNGMDGYISAGLSAPPSGFTSGFSSFVQIGNLNPKQTAHVQAGWGTWLQPNNDNYAQPLCPVGTLARDNWPERGPTWNSVFQTMEGGPGQWVSQAFPTTAAKFRINSTPDCYDTEVASTGWSFYQDLLPANKLGLVQLSNRLLTAPDGLVFSGTSDPGVLGYGYLALPIIPAKAATGNQAAIGNQSWTLFLKASNFGGPVAFFAPEGWTQVNANIPAADGRGLDARPMITGGLALEVGNLPMFTAKAANGKRYRRIPRVTFGADATTRNAVLHQNVRYYAKSAIWNAVQSWIDDGVVPTKINAAGAAAPSVHSPSISLTFGDKPVDMSGMISSTVANQSGFGIHWEPGANLGTMPQYYVETASGWKALPASQVPPETGLTTQVFPQASPSPRPGVNTSSASPFTSTKWSAGPFQAKLLDGSTVKYVWYKFTDQPAIARLGLSSATKVKLQAFAESLHAHSGVNGITLAAPASANLATLDAAQIVTPPAGLQKGYVPVVISQQ